MSNRKPIWIRQSNSAAVALTTLASLTALAIETISTIRSRVRMAALDLWVNGEGFTANETTKVLIGIAEGSMTVAEIAECLDGGGDSPYDAPGAERSRRKVKVFGFLGASPAQGAGVLQGHFKVNMTFDEALGWTIFAFNLSGAALTTGATLSVLQKVYMVAI